MERKRTRALDRLDNVARIRRLQVGGGGGGGGGAHVGSTWKTKEEEEGGAHVGDAHVLSLGCVCIVGLVAVALLELGCLVGK